MKKQLHFKLILATLFILTVSLPVTAQSYEMSKTLSKNAVVPADVRINISNHSGDIKFNTTNDQTVSIKTDIKVNARSREDAEKLIEAIENFQFDANGNSLDIDTRFYSKMNSINGRATITLENGDKVKIRDFEIKHEINIPKTAELNLKNKYSTVILGVLNGKAELNLYSSKLRCKKFVAPVKLETKYSKLQVENFETNAELNFYDSDLEFKTAHNFEIESKYSKIEGDKATNINFDSYDDKLLITKFDNLKMEAKYSDMISEADLDQLELDLYDCNIKTNSAKKVTFTGKYSDLKLGNVNDIKIPYSYDNNVYLGKNVSIQITESKYSKYEIKNTSKLEISGYDDDIDIDHLDTEFQGISFSNKYGKLGVNTGSVPFLLDVEMKYGKVNFPDTLPITKHIEKNSEKEIIAGKEGETILIRGYDNTINIE